MKANTKSCARICMIVALTMVSLCLHAQQPERRGYVGVGIGPTFLVNDVYSKPGTGLTLQLIHASYLIKNGWGVNLVWAGGAHIFDRKLYMWDGQNATEIPVEVTANYGILMAGPVYRIWVGETLSVECNARAGRFFAGEKFQGSGSSFDSKGESRTFSLGYSLAIKLKQDLGTRWTLQTSAELFSGRTESLFAQADQLMAFCVLAGIGFKF